MNKMIYSRNFELRTNDMDTFDNIKITTLLDIFQSVASLHADDLGLGFNDLMKKNLCWALIKSKILFVNYPNAYETIRCETWPLKKGRIDYIREFTFYGEDDRVIAKGSSKWCIIDYVKRSINRDIDVSYPLEPIDKVNFEEKFSNNMIFDISNMTPNYQHVFEYCDLDHNGHVNNAKYMDLIYSTLNPVEPLKINFCQFHYLHEAKKGDLISIYYVKEDNEYNFMGVIDSEVCFTTKITCE